MPPPQGKESPKNKELKLDIGKQKGLYDTPGIREQVLKWQTLSDVPLDPNAPEPPEQAKIEAISKPRPIPPAKETKTPKKKTEPEQGIKAASTPRKRIISDGHWKSVNASPKDVTKSAPRPIAKQKTPGTILDHGFYVAPGADKPEGWVRAKPPPKPLKPPKPKEEPGPPPVKIDVAAEALAWLTGSKEIKRWEITNDRGRQTKTPPVKPSLKAQIDNWNSGSEQTASGESNKGSPPPRPEERLRKDAFTRESRQKAARDRQARKEALQKAKNPTPVPEYDINEARNFKPDHISNWLGDTPNPFVEDPNEIDKYTSRRKKPPKDDEYLKDDDEDRSKLDDLSDFSDRGDRRRRRRSRLREQRETKDLRDPFDALNDKIDGSASASLKQNRPEDTAAVVLKVDDSSSKYGLATMPSLQPLQNREEQRINLEHLITDKRKSRDDTRTRNAPETRRKLTTDADLLSVLSGAHGIEGNLTSATSIRGRRSKANSTPLEDIMAELNTDESIYSKELHTLVDGVIPVLLNAALTKSKPVNARDQSSTNTDPTTSIVDMGVALERLKSLHKRIPCHKTDALLLWVQGAHRVYQDYLKVWKLGYEDVTVNLAPAEKSSTFVRATEMRLKDENGFTVNDNGEKVDVAFLLKRPVVRIKYLAKTLKAIHLADNSSKALLWSERFQDLVGEARKRQGEERARIEDQTAASIDSSRARDPQTLAPFVGAHIQHDKSVIARDDFDMSLYHSSGQTLDCRVEIIKRGKAPDYTHGDLLICEVNSNARWLLFPPISTAQVSARTGDGDRQMILMIRSSISAEQKWQELLVLTVEDPQAVIEWINMLGFSPVPPQVQQYRSFAQVEPKHIAGRPGAVILANFGNASPATPDEVDVPLGEQGSELSMSRGRYSPARPTACERVKRRPVSTPSQQDDMNHSTYHRPIERHAHWADDSHHESRSDRHTKVAEYHTPIRPKSSDQNSHQASNISTSVSQAYSEGQEKSRKSKWSLFSRKDRIPDPEESLTKSDFWESIKPRAAFKPFFEETNHNPYPQMHPKKGHDRTSSVPNAILQQTPRLRPNSYEGSISIPIPQQHPRSDVSPVRQMSPTKLSPAQEFRQQAQLPVVQARSNVTPPAPKQEQRSRADQSPVAPEFRQKPQQSSQMQDQRSRSQGSSLKLSPQRTPQRGTQQLQLQTHSMPQLEAPDSSTSVKRRSSSPLKHEYEPSDSDDSSLDATMLFDDQSSISSESSLEDIIPPLPPLEALKPGTKIIAPAGTVFDPANPGTLSPSHVGSEGSFSHVSEINVGNKTIASMFAWSDRGLWESIHPNECSIVVSPGLIEAYEMSAAHSIPTNKQDGTTRRPDGVRPVIGLELTPLVPLRRGTAIDISVRSPPIETSQVKSSNQIMFRSRNNQECDVLYEMIHQARLNNPTWIALENARGPNGQSNWASSMDKQGSRSSWWRLGNNRSSYRAPKGRPESTNARSEDSLASRSSATAALKRFSGSRMFSVAKSSISSRGGALKNAPSSFSSGSGQDSGTVTPQFVADPLKGSHANISNVKIRLYIRENTRWRDMGSARLTIMIPPRPPGMPPPIGRDGTLHQDKRIVVTGKTKGETLLDATLGETAFERVQRTGIAVSIWEQGKLESKGSVMTARAKVFMIQMGSEAQAAYTFSQVGRLRY